MATIKDVAQRAGVSISTVSKFINGGSVRQENAQAIREAVSELGFRANPFARGLKVSRSRSIGVLLPDLSAPFFGTVVTALDKKMREQGYHTMISCYSANHGLERDNLRHLIESGIEGLVYVPEDLSAEEYQELTASCDVPLVQLDRRIQGLDSDVVIVDNADAVYDATSRMVGRGHRRIGMIAGPKSVYSAKERQVGFFRALSDHGILFDDELFCTGENTFATGYQGAETLLSRQQKPTAILTTNYDITIGLITAVRDMGLRIPEDVDIFGFDCVNVCTMMKPPLPVVQQPEQEMGRLAAQCLIDRLDGYTGEPRVARLKCRIIMEDSLSAEKAQ